jgi:hypothetical protein
MGGCGLDLSDSEENQLQTFEHGNVPKEGGGGGIS